ncbi:MAG: hypothetical protein M3348_03765 [Acidobacteriota bacterium]|nr:hypothetical protein [Acidobacteriota bacterium]
MAQFYRVVVLLSWWLGLLSLLAAVVIRLGDLTFRVNIQPRSMLVVAMALFLCVLATRKMENTPTP